MVIHCKDHEAVGIIAQLVKEGLTFDAYYDNDVVRIHLTGGF